MKPWASALLLGCLLGPVLSSTDWTDLLAPSRYSPTEQNTLGGLVDSAVIDGLPEDFLLSRLKEGLAKKISYERLKLAIEREIDSLHRARSLLVQQFSRSLNPLDNAAWQRTAVLLKVGLSDQQAGVLLQAYRMRWNDYLAATELLFSLNDWGLSWPESVRITQALVNSPIPAKDFPALVGILTDARRAQIKPETSLTRLLEALPKAKSIAGLKRAVLPQ